MSKSGGQHSRRGSKECEGLAWATDAGLPDWDCCVNKATHTLYYIPDAVRAEVLAAHTMLGYVDCYPICASCAQAIRSMAEDAGSWGIWLSIDEWPDPFGD